MYSALKLARKSKISNLTSNNKKMDFKKIFTLVFIKHPQTKEILLGYKTRGLGKGLWNGFGGKIEPGESIIDGAIREVKEESNLDLLSLKQLGVVRYEVGKSISVVHVFTSENYKGEPKGSEEMNPVLWYPVEKIPYQKMWPDAKNWHQFMLKEKFFSALVTYDEKCLKITGIVTQDYLKLEEALEIC